MQSWIDQIREVTLGMDLEWGVDPQVRYERTSSFANRLREHGLAD